MYIKILRFFIKILLFSRKNLPGAPERHARFDNHLYFKPDEDYKQHNPDNAPFGAGPDAYATLKPSIIQAVFW